MSTTGVLCGKEWFNSHRNDVTQQMIDDQTLAVSNGKHTTSIKATCKIKDIKTVLKGIKA